MDLYNKTHYNQLKPTFFGRFQMIMIDLRGVLMIGKKKKHSICPNVLNQISPNSWWYMDVVA